MPRRSTTYRLPEDLLARLDTEAARRETTATALVETALERELDASAMRAELDAARAALRSIAALAAPVVRRR